MAPGGPSKDYLNDAGQFNYAVFLDEFGYYLKAAREFERVIELFPGSPLVIDAHFRIASAYFKAGRLEEARGQFRQFIENFSSDPLVVEASKGGEASKRLVEIEGLFERPGGASQVAPPGPPVALVGPAGNEREDDALGRDEKALRAVQVTLFQAQSYDELAGDLEELARQGVDTIILRVFQNPGDRFYPFVKPRFSEGVYFRTTHAPVVADALGGVLAIAHKTGLKVFAWMTTRYADYGLAGVPELRCKGYDIDTKEYVACRGLDIFNDEAVRHLEGLYSDLAAYDIDGILFQDDLVLRHTEGFGGYARALFKMERGRAMDPEEFYLRRGDSPHVGYTSSFWQWAAWKNKRLLKVAGRLKRAARARNPDLRFAINLMYESVTNPPYALAWLSQDLVEATKTGFDYYSIMAYQRQMAVELEKGPGEITELIEAMVVEAARVVGDPHKVLIKLQTIDWETSEPLADAEVVALLRKVRGAGDVSLAVVPYRPGFPFHELGHRQEDESGTGRGGGARARGGAKGP